MQNIKEDKMSKEEIIKYVDNLIKANKRYDKRLTPLLYDFFLRANEKFEWSREEFIHKYENFRNNVKKIKFKRLKKDIGGRFSSIDRAIIINKNSLKEIEENNSINDLIEDFFHECLHATDYTRNNGILSDRNV